MAKISAHGAIVGTIDYRTYSKRFMSDGVILVHRGFGWKVHGKIKAGHTPVEAFNRSREVMLAYRADRPAYAAYLKALHDMAGMGLRWKLHAAVEMMPDDPDGVWSECCDGYGDNVHADVDDVSDLCRAYKVALMEAQRLNAPATEG